MPVKSLSFAAALSLSAALLLGGCKSSTPPAQPAQPAQIPNSDGTTTQAAPPPSNSQTTAAAPAPAQTAASAPATVAPAPAPVAAEPVAPPPPPAPKRITAAAGAAVTVTVTERLSASHNSVGDRFTGVLAAPVRGASGVLFPRGTRVMGTVVA